MYKSDFIHQIKNSLINCGVDFDYLRKNSFPLGLGISGGADSVSLFLSLCEILKEERIPLVCVTVNHHIRPDSETDGDMHFVEALCNRKKIEGFNVKLDVYDLKENQVQKTLESRKNGIEDAARLVRYECFETSIKKNNIGHFCLAHNADDNLETILMRFLTGSASGGIEKVRGPYIRPLMNTKRSEIECFLNEMNQPYCTDQTNLSDDYFRNKIRHKLVPLLNEAFPLWDKGVLSGEEKRRTDAFFLEEEAEKYELTTELSEHGKEALWNRVLIRELNKAGVQERIPSAFLNEVLMETRKSCKTKKAFSMRFSDVMVEYKDEKLFVKSYEKNKTDFGFFDIIEECGEYLFPFGKVVVFKESENSCISIKFPDGKGIEQTVNLDTGFPFVIRSPQLGEKKQLFVIDF